jgi:hypothetical protein
MYRVHRREWQGYVHANIAAFSKEDLQSLMSWEIVKHGGVTSLFSAPLSEEQKLWIAVCGRHDEHKQVALIDSVIERLQPWLDYELWQNQKKKEEDTHVNVDYEKHRRELLESSFSEEHLDIIK